MSFLDNRYLTFTAIIRVNQIEITRSQAIGADERELNTPERVQALSDAFRAGFPSGRMTWALSWQALFDSSDNYRQIHILMRKFQRLYGDEVTFIPGGYFANVYNTRDEINRDVTEALAQITEIVGNGYRPGSIIAGMLPAACQKHLAESEGIHVVQGHIFSQYAIDNGSDDGSICYPYYTSLEHMLKPAQGPSDFVDCVNLDGWSVDFLAARFEGYKCGNSRMGVGPIETIGAFGLEKGVQQMLATTAMYFDAGFELNRFGFVTVSWEVSLEADWNAGLTAWLAQMKARWPEVKAVSAGEFGEAWRAEFKDNASLDYRFKTRGTGIGKGSDENLEMSWYMNQGFRLALLHDRKLAASPKVIDYTRYDLSAAEPQTLNVADWSLMNVLNMKRTRPQDVPIDFANLPLPEQTRILDRYRELQSLASEAPDAVQSKKSTSITLSIDKVPFSAFGSYMAIAHLTGPAAPNKVEGFYLRSFHEPRQSLGIRFELLRDGSPIEAEYTATPECLIFEAKDGARVEFCFDGARSLRVRGIGGLGLQFQFPDKNAHGCQHATQAVEVNLFGVHRRYMFTGVLGQVLARGLPGEATKVPIALEVQSDHSGLFEVAIDEFESTWVAPERLPFNAQVRERTEEFDNWLKSAPPVPEEFGEARIRAAYITWSCVVEPCGIRKRPAMIMSKNWMPHIWSWDHCFNALALAKGQPDLAWDQFLIMADLQDEFGAYPDSVGDSSIHYNYAKPPIHGLTLRQLMAWEPAAATPKRLEEAYVSLSRWTDWWLTYRRLPGRRLPYYAHGNDSGWDNATVFDRGVPLEAPDLAAYLIVQLDVLADLARLLGKEAEGVRFAETRDVLERDLFEQLWTGNSFVARLSLDNSVVESESLLECMPIVLGMRLPIGTRQALVARLKKHLTRWGLATEEPNSPKFRSDGYWRGPIWAPTSYLIVDGLAQIGEHALANTIAKSFCELCREHGFSENFDALTGKGRSDPAYSWTASVFLMFGERMTELA